MKILVIGDLHGDFPSETEKRIREEKFDLILSTGDFANFDSYRKIKFAKFDKSKMEDKVKNHLQDDEYIKMIDGIIKSMEKPLKVLDSFNIPSSDTTEDTGNANDTKNTDVNDDGNKCDICNIMPDDATKQECLKSLGC